MPSTVNLAPSKEFQSASPWEKIYLWGANAGKVIIILTNFVIISAWLYRWQLDRQIYNLAIDIENKQLAITSISKTEQKIRRIQNKLNIIKQVETAKTYHSKLINSFNRSTIEGIDLRMLSFPSENTINITATAKDGETFAKYVSQLLFNEEILEVILYSSNLNGDTKEYSFVIEVTINGNKT